MADLRVFLDANILFRAASSPEGLSALVIALGASGRLALLTSPLAVIEAQRNLEAKAPAVLPAFEESLVLVEIVREPAPADVERLTPSELSARDRPIPAAAIAARATHFLTGDERDFGRWMARRTHLPLMVMTPRQFLMGGPR